MGLIKKLDISGVLWKSECGMRMYKINNIAIVLVVMIIVIFYNGIDVKMYKYWWEGMNTEEGIEVIIKGNKYYYKIEIHFI